MCFENIGFSNVKTLLATGNVVFEGNSDQLEKIPLNLQKTFGFNIDFIILPFSKIADLVSSDPFKGESIHPNIKLYLTFFKKIKASDLKLPFTSTDNSIKLLKIEDNVIYGLANLEISSTVEYMKLLDKEFGKKLTTRNFETVKKLLNL